MNALANSMTEDRRLQILDMLGRAAGYELNHEILTAALPSVGHRPSTDQLLGDLGWLEEQGLLTTRRMDRYTIATATQRGIDVGQGRSRTPGVRRPGPA